MRQKATVKFIRRQFSYGCAPSPALTNFVLAPCHPALLHYIIFDHAHVRVSSLANRPYLYLDPGYIYISCLSSCFILYVLFALAFLLNYVDFYFLSCIDILVITHSRTSGKS